MADPKQEPMILVTCPLCKGSGKRGNRTCPLCKGEKKVKVAK